jgi:O-antigen/teichoic acid export membrane protein
MIGWSDRHRLKTQLAQIAAGGAAAIGVSVASTSIMRIVSSMTLTRLLDSHAYGVIGVITSISYMLAMLAEVGMYAFIVRHADGDDPHFRDQLWTIRFLRGAILTAAMMILAKPAAMLLGKPELAPVVAVWGISFLIDGLSSLAFATAVREQKLWRMSLLDIGRSVATFLVSLLFALVWHSYWAMIAGMIAGALLSCFLSYALFPRSVRRFAFSRERSGELWGFSRYIALSSMLTLLIMQSDKVVLARLMPLPVYGLYAIATTLAVAPGALAAPYCTRVLFAVYSQTVRKNRDALRRVLYDTRRKVVLLYMFGVAAMIGGAPLLVELLYDPRYRGVVPYLQLISISTLLRMPSLAANQALIAIGRTRSTLFANVFRVIWLVIGGGVALWMDNIMLLVATVGTIEVPGILCFWFNLWRAKLLNVVEEGYGLAAAGVGLGVGFGVSQVAMRMFVN